MSGVFQFAGVRFSLAIGLVTAALAAPIQLANAQGVQVQDRAQLFRPPSSQTDPYSEENGVENGQAVEYGQALFIIG